MESAIRGLVLDSTVLVAADRANQTASQVLEHVRANVGDVPIVMCALTVAEVAHGIHCATRLNAPSNDVIFANRARRWTCWRPEY